MNLLYGCFFGKKTVSCHKSVVSGKSTYTDLLKGTPMICLNVILTVKNEADISQVKDLLVQQSEMTLKEPGCIRFEVYHSESDPQIFILNERWESAESLDVHRNAEACSTIYFPKVVPLCDRVPHPSTLVE